MAKNAAQISEQLIGMFRMRARGLRLTAFGILGIIFLLLAGGASAFILAPQITLADFFPAADEEKQYISLTEEQKRLKTISDSEGDKFGRALVLYVTESSAVCKNVTSIFGSGLADSGGRRSAVVLEIEIASATPKGIADEISSRISLGDVFYPIRFLCGGRNYLTAYYAFEDMTRALETLKTINFPKFPDKPEPSSVVGESKERLALLDAAIAQLQKTRTTNQVAKLLGRPASSPASEAAPKPEVPFAQLVQTNITRFGTIIMITFLVSILTPLYRYNIRLATYYDARADVLQMCKTNFKSVGFVELSTALTPAFSFGKEPTTPVEQLISLAREIAGKKDGVAEKPKV